MIIKHMELQDFRNAKAYFLRNQQRPIVESKLDAAIELYGTHPSVIGMIAYEGDEVIGLTFGCWKDTVHKDSDFHIEHFHVEKAGAGRQLMERLLAALSVYEYNEVLTCAGIENAAIYENLCKKFNFMYSGGRAMSRKREL